MAENKKNIEENEEEYEVITLTEEDGTEIECAIIAEYNNEKNGNTYYAVIRTEEEPDEEGVFEYSVLKLEVENGENFLVTVDDEDEEDEAAAYFDNELSKIYYDED